MKILVIILFVVGLVGLLIIVASFIGLSTTEIHPDSNGHPIPVTTPKPTPKPFVSETVLYKRLSKVCHDLGHGYYLWELQLQDPTDRGVLGIGDYMCNSESLDLEVVTFPITDAEIRQ